MLKLCQRTKIQKLEKKFSKSTRCIMKGGPAVPSGDIPEESLIKPSCMQQKNIIQNKVHNINKMLACI